MYNDTVAQARATLANAKRLEDGLVSKCGELMALFANQHSLSVQVPWFENSLRELIQEVLYAPLDDVKRIDEDAGYSEHLRELQGWAHDAKHAGFGD